jgi:hypothetical protein
LSHNHIQRHYNGKRPDSLRSIGSLYPLALAEGEGIGTAYEYFAKRCALARWQARPQRAQRVLIAGLPEKYGSSLDFLLLAQEMAAAEVVVVDDRPEALEKLNRSLANARALGELSDLVLKYLQVNDISRIDELNPPFDICIGSEVLQRLDPARRQKYLRGLATLAPALALFAPNAENPNHTTLSGLSGLAFGELQSLVKTVGAVAAIDYVDMPPFPPGLMRSAEQRQQATTGTLEQLAMWSLGYYARLERFFPSNWRKSHSHIVYAFVETRTLRQL